MAKFIIVSLFSLFIACDVEGQAGPQGPVGGKGDKGDRGEDGVPGAQGEPGKDAERVYRCIDNYTCPDGYECGPEDRCIPLNQETCEELKDGSFLPSVDDVAGVIDNQRRTIQVRGELTILGGCGRQYEVIYVDSYFINLPQDDITHVPGHVSVVTEFGDRAGEIGCEYYRANTYEGEIYGFYCPQVWDMTGEQPVPLEYVYGEVSGGNSVPFSITFPNTVMADTADDLKLWLTFHVRDTETGERIIYSLLFQDWAWILR